MVKQIQAFRDETHAGIHSVMAPAEMNISLGALFPRFFKPIDVFCDANNGALTIDNLRAAAYRSNYTPNDCKTVVELMKKFVESCTNKDLKEKMAERLNNLDETNDISIKNTCAEITEVYDLYARYDLVPKYEIYKWNDTYQYITPCGALSFDNAKARNLKLMTEDEPYNRQHRMHVSMEDIKTYKDKEPLSPVHGVRELVIIASKQCPNLKVSYVPDKGLDFFIYTNDKPKYIPVDMDMKDFRQIGLSAVREAFDKAGYHNLNKDEKKAVKDFYEAYKHEANYRFKVAQFNKLDPPVKYTREEYEEDIKKERQQAQARARAALDHDTAITI